MADTNEKLILEVEAKGATEATVAIKGLDAVALQAEAILTALGATSAALTAGMSALSGATAAATTAIQTQTIATANSGFAIEANTAATLANTAALTTLVSALATEHQMRISGLVAMSNVTTAISQNTAVTVANTVATEAGVIATEVNTVAATAATAASATNTAANTANAVALAANTAATVANTATRGANAGATTAGAAATGAGTLATIAATAAWIASTVAQAAMTVATWALTAAMLPLNIAIGAVSVVAGAGAAVLTGLATVIMGLVAPLVAVLTPLYAFKKLVEGTRTYQDFQAQLEVVTGSVEKASQAYAALVDYAIKTPYGLKQATDGFVKLVNFGLDPSERAMRALGNIASGTAREFDQMVQAVAMATVNNFVRLKQFGILGRKAGDDVIFTFQGVTTKVKANAKEIQGYLIGLGETAFAGAMERRMLSLSGVLSNLGDAWSLFWQAVAKQGPDAAITKSFRFFEQGLIELTAQLESGQFGAELEAYAIGWRVTFERIAEAVEYGKTVVSEGIGWIMQFIGATQIDWADFWAYFPIYVGQALDTAIAYFKYWSATGKAESELLRSNIVTMYEQVTGYAKVFIDVFIAGWNAIKAGIAPFVEAFSKGFAFVASYVGQVAEEIKQVWELVYSAVSAVATAIVDWFKIQFDRLIGYAKVAGSAVTEALSGIMPDIGAKIQAVTDAAVQATENFQKNIKAGVETVQKGLADVTDKANTRYELASQKSAEAAAQAAANLQLEQGVIQETTDALKREYDAKWAESRRLRKEYEDKIAGQKASGQDRLAEFEKSGNGEGYNGAAKSGKGGGSREQNREEREQKRQLETRMRLVEEGILLENQVISDAYAERKQMILANETTTLQEKEALILTAMMNSIMTEEQALQDSYDRRRDIILSATELTETAKNDLILRLEKARAKAQQKVELDFMLEKSKQLEEGLGNLQQVAEAYGKRGFEVAKGLSMAKAVVSTAAAAMKAYEEGGPYAGPALAATIVAAGAAQIATIASTKYDGPHEHGGMIPAGKFGLVGEAGPEFITGPAVVTSAATTRNNGSLAGNNRVDTVVVHNYGPPVEASSSMDEGQLKIILKPMLQENKRQVKKEIAADFQRGGGEVSKAAEGTYGLSRAKNMTA